MPRENLSDLTEEQKKERLREQRRRYLKSEKGREALRRAQFKYTNKDEVKEYKTQRYELIKFIESEQVNNLDEDN